LVAPPGASAAAVSAAVSAVAAAEYGAGTARNYDTHMNILIRKKKKKKKKKIKKTVNFLSV